MPTIAFNKPYDVLTKFTDDRGRVTLADYIPVPDVYPAGRLDKDSEGLLLLTDDGELQHLITHPRHTLEKVYLSQVERIPDQPALDQLEQGVIIKKKKTRPAQVVMLPHAPDLPPRPIPIRYRKNVPTVWLKITLSEGRYRQVRRMTAAVGHPTLRLVRVSIGPVTIEGLLPGEWRMLTPEEVRNLRRAAGG